MGRMEQIMLIEEYIEDLPHPEKHKYRMKHSDLVHEACLNWAAKEILYLVQNDAEKRNAIIIVEEFINKMDEFSCMKASASILFGSCKVLAEDLLDQLYCMKH